MHEAVLDWVRRWAGDARHVLDLGGRDVNGTCRRLFPEAQFYCVDVRPGVGVNFVGDARTWRSELPEPFFDVVLCTEVFEHLPGWSKICETAYTELKPGGRFIVTCAGPGRAPHSGRAELPHPEPDEHYANIEPGELDAALRAAGFEVAVCHQAGLDTQALAIKPLRCPLPEDGSLDPKPFRHQVYDELWPDWLLDDIVGEFPDAGPNWKSYRNDNEVKLEGGSALWGPSTHTLFATLGSTETLERLSVLTGIADLSMELVGGGYHLIPPGGRLGMHTDFNRSAKSGLFRRLNFLVYLNRWWEEYPGGCLVLGPDHTGYMKTVEPEFNRTVVFETSERSWHGHPDPANRWRRSVAAYYFSPEAPAGYTHDHSTVWKTP